LRVWPEARRNRKKPHDAHEVPGEAGPGGQTVEAVQTHALRVEF
jgi:hypothetical protein